MQIRIPPNYGKNYVAAFESIYSEIAEEKNIPILTFLLEKVALNKSLMQLDGIHPNQKAQQIIANQVGTRIVEYFQIKKSLCKQRLFLSSYAYCML